MNRIDQGFRRRLGKRLKISNVYGANAVQTFEVRFTLGVISTARRTPRTCLLNVSAARHIQIGQAVFGEAHCGTGTVIINNR